PGRFASLLVERDDGRLIAARRDDNAVAIDERRLTVAPAALLAAELLLEVAVPDFLAVLIDANEVALLAECEDGVAVNRRGATEVTAGRSDFGGPDLLAVFGV